MKILLAALLIIALLTPTALMEEAPAGESVVTEIETTTEEAPEDVSDNVPEDVSEDVHEAAVIPEAVDAVVMEACAIALDGVVEDVEPVEALDEAENERGDAPTFEAQIIEESLDNTAEYEAAEETSAPEGEATVAEETAEESAKALAEAAGEIHIDEAHFPDPNFRRLLSANDKDGNGVLSGEELEDLSDFNLSSADYPITDVRGLEYLTPIQYLNCQYTSLTSLDVSCLPNLVYLNCDFSRNLKSLTLGALPALTALSVRCCDSLASVDISRCPTLLRNIAGRKPKLRRVYWNEEIGKLSYYIWGWDNNEESHCVYYTANTGIDAGGMVAAENAISVTGKRAKATATVGVPCQIDAGGKAGKGYKSSKKSVASVSASGLIIPRKAGTTRITFKVGKKKRTLTLTVNDPTIPTAVTLNLTGTQTAKVGERVTLTATMNVGAVSGYKWKSSNKKVATVKNGVVTFKKKGKVTITCTTKRGKKKAKIRFKVSK